MTPSEREVRIDALFSSQDDYNAEAFSMLEEAENMALWAALNCVAAALILGVPDESVPSVLTILDLTEEPVEGFSIPNPLDETTWNDQALPAPPAIETLYAAAIFDSIDDHEEWGGVFGDFA